MCQPVHIYLGMEHDCGWFYWVSATASGDSRTKESNYCLFFVKISFWIWIAQYILTSRILHEFLMVPVCNATISNVYNYLPENWTYFQWKRLLSCCCLVVMWLKKTTFRLVISPQLQHVLGNGNKEDMYACTNYGKKQINGTVTEQKVNAVKSSSR